MKIQSISILFIIIIIPIILVVSFYMKSNISMLNQQIAIDTKLVDAVKEAIEAFEINTVEWNNAYSSIADSKRRSILASINTLVASLGNGLGVGGTSREYLLQQMPAIVYTLYDGYYLYAPSTVPVVQVRPDSDPEAGTAIIGANGNPIATGGTENKHMLRTFIAYTGRYIQGSRNIIVNYTLDNYVKIYAIPGYNGEQVTRKAGYLINPGSVIWNNNTISNLRYQPISTEAAALIEPEMLSENVSYRTSASGTFVDPIMCRYVYAEDGSKIYFDASSMAFRITDRGVRANLSSGGTLERDSGFVYKKVSVPTASGCATFYQALNGARKGNWYRDTNNDGLKSVSELAIDASTFGLSADLLLDYSSVNYYVEARYFSQWVNSNLSGVQAQDKRTPGGGQDLKFAGDTSFIFVLGTGNNDPENENGIFVEHKRAVIRQVIGDNLNQAIVNYGRINPGVFDFKMPQISEDEWRQIESNVSIIAFLQGIPIGNKYYSNYAIAISTKNQDYVDPNEIYFVGVGNQYYHRRNCDRFTPGMLSVGYKGVDFVVRRTNHENPAEFLYYYPHADAPPSTNAHMACYYCVVNEANFSSVVNTNAYNKLYYQALRKRKICIE